MKTKTGILTATAIATIISMGGMYDTANAATVGYWRFEDGAFLNDSSGNGNTLTAVGSMVQVDVPAGFPLAVPLTGAPNGKVADFPGSAAAGFSAPDSASLDGIATSGQITIEAFVRHGSTATTGDENAQYVASQYNSGTGNASWSLQINASRGLTFILDDNGSLPVVTFTSSNSLFPSAANIYYLAASYDATDPTPKATFYWQDMSDPLSTLQSEVITVGNGTSPAALFDTAADLEIGFRSGSSKRYPTAGKIDEVRISDTVLSSNALLVVPEPTSLALLGLGGLALLRRSRK